MIDLLTQTALEWVVNTEVMKLTSIEIEVQISLFRIFLDSYVWLISYSTRIKVRNYRRTLFTFEHTALLFW